MHGNPLQDSWLENPHGQRSLVGCGPQGHKEVDMIEATDTNIHSYEATELTNIVNMILEKY